MLKHFLEQIQEIWLEQTDNDFAFMSEITVCKELGEILKREGFNFEFDPNMEGMDTYYKIPVYIDDIDKMFSILYE